MEWLFGITAIIGIGASIAGTTIYLRRETKRAMEAWREVVKRLGGRYDPTLGFVVEMDDAIVHAPRPAARRTGMLEIADGPGTIAHPDRLDDEGDMVLEARYPLPGGGPRYAIRPRDGGFVRTGGRVVKLGRDEAFDELMIVNTNDLEGTYDAFNEEVQEMIVRSLSGCMIYSDGSSVIMRHLPPTKDKLCIEDALRTLGALANTDAFGLPALRSLPGGRYEGAAGPWAARTEARALLVLRGHEVLLAPRLQREDEGDGLEVASEACAYCKDLPDFKAAVDRIGHASARLPEGLFIDAAPLAQCGEGWLLARGGLLTFRWRGIERDPVRLMAAARLLADLATRRESSGYR
ncbi:MAG: hypothetical protein KC503_04050 [Myxococcales bacterium]|nr:hypothetical protein [Myxococcales bacterium]